MQTNLIQGETRTLLEQWGKWARICPETSQLSHPKMAPFRRLILVGARATEPCISEDMALYLDASLAGLIGRNEETGIATAAYYLLGLDYTGLAKRISVYKEMNRHKIKILVDSGTAWIDGKLHGD